MADIEANQKSIEANKEKVRQFYDRSHAGDLAVYDEMFRPRSQLRGPAGELHGPAASTPTA